MSAPDNCTKCPSHEISRDPDPHDWFCDDDVKVQCKITRKYITVACRPHHIVKECVKPEWCPLEKAVG